MKIELNAQELEAAVISHLTNVGMDMKKKDISFEFEGTCSVSIEDQVSTTSSTPKPKQTRKKKAPVVKEEVKVEKVVEELEEQTKAKEEKPAPKESAADLFGTSDLEEETETLAEDTDDNSLFG